MTEKTRYIPVSKWEKYHPWPTVPGLRKYIRNKKKYGFEKVIVEVNKRLLVDENAFYEWVEGFKKIGMKPKRSDYY